MNYTDFSLYAGRTGNTLNPNIQYTTLNIGSSLVLTVNGSSYGTDIITCTKALNLTTYSKIKFTYSGVQLSANYNFMKFIIFKTKASDISATVSKELLAVNTTTKNGTLEVDVSNLSGDYFVAFEIASGNGTSTLTISDMTME
jgi:hypothetical protein